MHLISFKNIETPTARYHPEMKHAEKTEKFYYIISSQNFIQNQEWLPQDLN